MAEKPRYYITTAIAYPNGPPHIGYGYEVITTDAIARFKRLDGYDVFFLTGTDEHGIKIAQTAGRDGITPQALVDKNSARFQEMAKLLNASNDQFIRTTEPRHHKSSQAIWDRMKANGDIYLSKYAGWYSVRDEAYYDESETRIENGVRLGALNTPVEWVEEESYFFKLSAYQDKLLKLYADVPDFLLPRERLNEVASFVRGGLRDLSISRTTFDWGVKVPGDEKHVMYVWIDALTNYITAAGFPDDQSAAFKKWWPADLHVIGKDIVRFHAVYWPAFLMSAGIEVPRKIFSHGWILNRGEKMSKSVGNVVDPFDLAKAYGVDPLRYFFMREVSFGQDGNYSHEAIVARINADLSNDLGNLAQRSLTMIGKAFGGVMPTPGAFSENDKAILSSADAMIGKARDAMNGYALHQVLNAVWAVVADANRYFAGEAPWALAKTDPARQGTVLYVTAEVIRQVAILAQPFVPTSAAKILDLLGIPEGKRSFAALGGAHRIAPGTKLGEIKPVFPRYVEPEAGEPKEPGPVTAPTPKPAPTPKKAFRELEELVARIQQQLAPKAKVIHNVRLDGRVTGTKRQIDVLVKENIGQYEINIIIDCKDHKVPVDVKDVEAFDGLLRDVGAQKGVLVSPKGFSAAAKKLAQARQIDLYSPIDTDVHKWQARITIPAVCDFRSAALAFGLSGSSHHPFQIFPDFFSSSPVFDKDGKNLGTALDAALAKWNEGRFPTEPGEHRKLEIFDTPVFVDNGYDPPVRIPVGLTVSLLVQQQLYFGQLPVPEISGFHDHFSGGVITNAFTVGLLDPDEIEKQWRKLNSEDEAPVRPVIRILGLVGWSDEQNPSA